ncbi:MAG TPA: hypothetical protein VNL94_06035 [Candidatus Binatia bacterium]|nr:hypothetical protein [Candidatus Binatia bacterium]
MTTREVEGFRPSRHGLRFANRWTPGPARQWDLGLVHVGIGQPARGLCGGMAYLARDRFERGEAPPEEAEAPAFGTPLFRTVVDRQFDSFGPLWIVPLRFWIASALYDDRRRTRESVKVAWPAIRRDIDAGRLPVIGLVREAGWNPLSTGMGHQVLGYRFDASPERIAIGVYDPNHPGRDDVELAIERGHGGDIRLSQSTGEALLGLLHLPYVPPR